MELKHDGGSRQVKSTTGSLRGPPKLVSLPPPVGRQQRLSDGTSDRGRSPRQGQVGENIAIELKNVEARRGDYTRLTSYMGRPRIPFLRFD